MTTPSLLDITMLPLVAALVLAQPPAAPHETANALYKQLLDPGLDVGAGARAKLPPPTMPDGLDGAKQTAVIKQLIGTDYSYDEFTRPSVVAPQLLRIRNVKPSDPQAPARGVDVWFVVHGDFARTTDNAFLDRLAGAGRDSGGKGKELTAADLMKRKIVLPPNPGKDVKEGYGAVEFDFLEKVRIRATGRSVWTRTAESVLAAAEIDPRFAGDAEFPNDWRPLTKAGGKVAIGEAKPWAGAGFYLKVTKLAEPAGAMFVEQHVVFAEPTGWFEGANLLGSKLPIAVQGNVRSMRREWLK